MDKLKRFCYIQSLNPSQEDTMAKAKTKTKTKTATKKTPVKSAKNGAAKAAPKKTEKPAKKVTKDAIKAKRRAAFSMCVMQDELSEKAKKLIDKIDMIEIERADTDEKEQGLLVELVRALNFDPDEGGCSFEHPENGATTISSRDGSWFTKRKPSGRPRLDGTSAKKAVAKKAKAPVEEVEDEEVEDEEEEDEETAA